MATKIKYSMPRGDSRSLEVYLPIDDYEADCHLYFTIKPLDDVDSASSDSTAVVSKTLGDSNITATSSTQKTYLLELDPIDTNSVTPGVYRAEIEYVSADASIVLTYPDPDEAKWFFTITGDVTRRTA